MMAPDRSERARSPKLIGRRNYLAIAVLSPVETFRSVSRKHVPRRLAEFEYRFKRRYDLPAMIPRLGWVAVRTPPMPYRLLKLAEDYG